MIQDHPNLQAKWVRIAPHVNDTFLLVAAVSMLVTASINPLYQPWLLAKFTALFLYILLGMVALRRGKTKQIRVIAFSLSLLTFGYLVSVALTKHPLGVVSLL